MPLIDNSALYLDIETSDLTIVVCNTFTVAHKQVLSEASTYFKQLFADNDNVDDESQTIEISAFDIEIVNHVLKVVYRCDVEDSEWQALGTEKLFKAAIMAKNYRFVEALAIISKRIEMPVIENKPERDHNGNYVWSIFDVLEMAIHHELERIIDICLNYVDNNSHQIVKSFDHYVANHIISPIVLIAIFKRDTFGVAEIDIFEMVNKWLDRHKRSKAKLVKQYRKPLIATIRLDLLTVVELTSIVRPANMFDCITIANALQRLKAGKPVNNQRQYTAADNKVKVKQFNEKRVSVSGTTFPKRPLKGKQVAITYASKTWIDLPKPTLINKISFDLMKNDDFNSDAIIHYYVDVVSKSKWIRIIDNSHCICMSNQTQLLTFNKRLVSTICIVGVNLTGTFKIKKLWYELASNAIPKAVNKLEQLETFD